MFSGNRRGALGRAQIYKTREMGRRVIKDCHIAMGESRSSQVTFNNMQRCSWPSGGLEETARVYRSLKLFETLCRRSGLGGLSFTSMVMVGCKAAPTLTGTDGPGSPLDPIRAAGPLLLALSL